MWFFLCAEHCASHGGTGEYDFPGHGVGIEIQKSKPGASAMRTLRSTQWAVHGPQVSKGLHWGVILELGVKRAVSVFWGFVRAFLSFGKTQDSETTGQEGFGRCLLCPVHCHGHQRSVHLSVRTAGDSGWKGHRAVQTESSGFELCLHTAAVEPQARLSPCLRLCFSCTNGNSTTFIQSSSES